MIHSDMLIACQGKIFGPHNHILFQNTYKKRMSEGINSSYILTL